MNASPKPTLFLIFPTSFVHFSDIIRGPFLRELARRFRVIVFTPAIDSEVARREDYFCSESVEYRKISPSYPAFWSLIDAYLRVPLIREFDYLNYIRLFYERPQWWPRKLLMRLRVLLPKRFITVRRMTRLESKLAKPSPSFLELISNYKPSLFLTATPGFSPLEAEAIIFAKNLGIPTAAININYDNLTSNVKRMRPTDYIAVWNERMAKEAKTLHHYPKERVSITGGLRFDHYFTDPNHPKFPSREEFFRQKRLDPFKPTVVLAGPTPSNYPPRRELAEELIRLRQAGKFAGNPNILIRLHPSDNLDTYRGLENADGVRIETPGRSIHPSEEDVLNSTATLRYADVFLNFASTMIIEACLFDKPVINIAFPDNRRIVYEYEYNKALVDTGAVRLANSPKELAELINCYLKNPGLDGARRAKLVEEYVPVRDGRAWLRTVEFIERISAKRP